MLPFLRKETETQMTQIFHPAGANRENTKMPLSSQSSLSNPRNGSHPVWCSQGSGEKHPQKASTAFGGTSKPRIEPKLQSSRCWKLLWLIRLDVQVLRRAVELPEPSKTIDPGKEFVRSFSSPASCFGFHPHQPTSTPNNQPQHLPTSTLARTCHLTLSAT